MAIQFLSSIQVTGTISASSISNDNNSYTGILVWDGGVLKYRTKSQILSDIGATGNTGTVTSVTVLGGSGLSGGGTVTTSGTITLANADRGSSQSIYKNFTADSGGTATANINNDTMDIAGGTNVSTARSGDSIIINATDTTTNYYLTSLSFNTSNGILTATRNGLSSITVDLDGRYVTSSGVTSVATGNGISGGTITSTGTLTVGAGDGLSQSSTGLLVNNTVVRTSGTQTIAGLKTFSNNLTMANTADLKFVDLAGTFPTSGKGFDWTLNNDGARIYAIQPSSDSIDLTFELRDNATTNDRFVFHVNDYQGAAFDKYPLIIRGGTQFDLVDSALYTNGTIRLSNSGVLSNVTNTNWDAAYNDRITGFSDSGSSTITLTLTQQDGGTLTTSFSNPQGNVTTGGFTSGRVPFANTLTNLDNSANLTFSGSTLTIGQPVHGAGALKTAGQIYIEYQGTNWNETTPGQTRGALHMDPAGNAGDNTGNAITFGSSDHSGGTVGDAGIYVRSDGSYGTKMYIATTDSYAVGSKTAITIDEAGDVAINRGHLTINDVPAASSSGNAFLVSNSGQVQRRTNAQVRSDIGAGTSSTTGTVTSVATGTGLSGGTITTTGTITNTDRGSSQAIFKNFAASSGGTATANSNNDTLTIAAGSNITTVRSGDTITINATNDGQGVTSVATGGGLTGGTITSTGTLSHADTSSQGNVNNSGNTYIQDVTLDTYGHVTSLTSATTTLLTLGYTGATDANRITNNNQITNGAGYVTSSGGSMSSWTLKEGNGTETSSVTNGETVTFAQGNGIESELTSTSSGGTLTITNTKPNIVQTTITGNAGTATKLQTARTISGTSFNGSANITLNNANITNGAGYVTSSGGSMSSWNLIADSGGITSISNTETVDIAGGTNITTSRSANTVTITNSITNNNQLTNGRNFITAGGNVSQFVNNSGYITASSTNTLTNKGGNISQWTNNSGYITSGSLPTVNNATITLTAGTGLTGGGTITLNQSSNETVTFNNSITNNNQLTNGAGYTTNTGTTTASNTQTFTNKSGNISQWSNNSGYVTSSGVTSIKATTTGNSLGLSGAVTSTGALTLPWQGNTSQFVRGDGSLATFPSIPGAGVTSVATGSGLTGGTITGTGTLSVDYGSSGLISDAPGGGGTPDADDLVLLGLDSSSSGETRSYALSDLPFLFNNNASTQNFTVTSTLNVRGVIDLADNDILRFGTGDDVEMFFSGSDMFMDINNGEDFKIRDGNSGNATRFTFDADGGNFTASGNVTAFSDERLKDNIETLDGSKVLDMRGVSYTKDGKAGSGVIAQELEKVAPELVMTNVKEDGMKSVAYGNLVGYLIEAVKDQQKQIDELKLQLDGFSK